MEYQNRVKYVSLSLPQAIGFSATPTGFQNFQNLTTICFKTEKEPAKWLVFKRFKTFCYLKGDVYASSKPSFKMKCSRNLRNVLRISNSIPSPGGSEVSFVWQTARESEARCEVETGAAGWPLTVCLVLDWLVKSIKVILLY